jgi:hypothetical protein
LPNPGAQSHVEHLHVDLAYVSPHPFIKNTDEETAITLRRDRAFGDQVTLLHIQRTLLTAGSLSPTRVGDRQYPLGHPLHNGDELDKLGAQFIPEEAVDLHRTVDVCGVDRAQDVKLCVVLFPIRKLCSLKNAHHSSSSLVPLVCML